jgi:hypothetical protein
LRCRKGAGRIHDIITFGDGEGDDVESTAGAISQNIIAFGNGFGDKQVDASPNPVAGETRQSALTRNSRPDNRERWRVFVYRCSWRTIQSKFWFEWNRDFACKRRGCR